MVRLNDFDNNTYTVGCIEKQRSLLWTLKNISSILNNYTAWAGYNSMY